MDNVINTKAFGKNDIRGIFPSEVNATVFFYAAKAYTAFVLSEMRKTKADFSPRELLFTVSMDARLHSPALSKSLVEGILSTGANVVDLGLAPTPIGYYSEVVGVPPPQ